MTERLYYDDSYTRTFAATIVEVTTANSRPALVLDMTYFYPMGGGQPNDTGTINGDPVTDVLTRDVDNAVLHLLGAPVENAVEGMTVECVVDWQRRFDFMQQHTGQHIFARACDIVAGADTVGFHLSPETLTMDIDKTDLSVTQLAEIEVLSNKIVWENRAVSARVLQSVDMEGIRIRRMPAHITTDGFRVVEVEGFDLTTCGGTHVRHTGEIGMIKIVKTEKRGDKLRVEMACGQRALADYGMKHQAITTIASSLTCGVEETPQAVARLQTQFRDVQRDLKMARGELLTLEAAALLEDAETVPNVNHRLIVRVFDNRSLDELKLLAALLTKNEDAIALLASTTSDGTRNPLVFARGATPSADMNALLKTALAALTDGRGGGNVILAQGSATATRDQLEAALNTAREKI